MKSIISIFLILLSVIPALGQDEDKSAFIEIVVEGLLENPRVQAATYTLNGDNYVFFCVNSEWIGPEYIYENSKGGISYKIWTLKYLFFYNIQYYISIGNIVLSEDVLTVNYSTQGNELRRSREYFSGTMVMKKKDDAWIVVSNKIKN